MDISKLFLAFLVGGIVCALIQVLIDLTKLTPARILVILVCFGTFLGAVGLYESLFELAGAGISVPLIGFGANVAKGVKEAVDSFGFIGIFKGPFAAASAGCTAALIFGYLACLIFKGKPKRSR
ncbi:MAG: SpoVA/SpoVAEb family sporulation membrane protein [Clostridia bacterium]|nr:SpoVA/SpoVAEb family sporulation membrane protein [Clostridia bacterium]